MQVDLNILEDYVDRNLLRKQEDEDLVQYNYSEYCNNNALWDEITMFNRGNIYEKKTGNLIARAMPKFMNFGQHDEETQKVFLNRTFTVTEKLDGCLGILYKYKGKIRCNSRGSFDNYVTDKIKDIIDKKHYVLLNHLLEYQTLNVEVISPETKIICDYGDEESLYLITSYSTISWNENTRMTNDLISQCTYIPIVKQVNMTWDELLTWQKESDGKEEGFVLCFENEDGTYDRVKVKSDDYMKIAAAKRNLCRHTLWKLMKSDLEQKTDLLSPYMDAVPDELAKTAQRYYKELLDAMEVKQKEAYDLYLETKDVPQKELCKVLMEKNPDLRGAVFNIRKGIPIDKILIKLIEPEPGFEDIGGMFNG